MHLQQQRRKTVVTKRLRTRSTFTPHIQSVTDSISQRVTLNQFDTCRSQSQR